MSQQELVKTVIEKLDSLGIPYMLTGSIVSSLQGEPRSTHDIDLIVLLRPSDIEPLLKAFPPSEFYISKTQIVQSIEKKDMFNIITLRESQKIDFWLLTDDPFDQSRFSRRYAEDFMGIKIFVSSPEDTILAKLRWAYLAGGSEKQFTDALRVFEVQYNNLDLTYLEKWVGTLHLDPLWERLKKEGTIIN